MIFGPERDPGKVFDGIGIVGIEFQPLDYHSVVGVQGFEPVQRFLGRSEQFGIAIVLNQIDAEYGKTQRSRTDTEKHNKQNGPDNVSHLAWPTVETSQFSIAEIQTMILILRSAIANRKPEFLWMNLRRCREGPIVQGLGESNSVQKAPFSCRIFAFYLLLIHRSASW